MTLTEWFNGTFDKVYRRIFSRRSSEAFFGCIPIAVFVLANSAAVGFYSMRMVLVREFAQAVLCMIWAVYGVLPATDIFRCGHSLNVTLAFWAFVVGVAQSIQWIVMLIWNANSFRHLTSEQRQEIFDARMQRILGEKLEFSLGLVWDDIGGWIFITFFIVAAALWLRYTCEMYRSFYLHVLDGSRGWEIGQPKITVPPTLPASADTEQQRLQQQQQQPLLGQPPATGGLEDVANSMADAVRRQQREVEEYREKLYAYYQQYGELGQRAAATGLPVEQYIQELPSGQREKWEVYLQDLLAAREGDESGSADITDAEEDEQQGRHRQNDGRRRREAEDFNEIREVSVV